SLYGRDNFIDNTIYIDIVSNVLKHISKSPNRTRTRATKRKKEKKKKKREAIRDSNFKHNLQQEPFFIFIFLFLISTTILLLINLQTLQPFHTSLPPILHLHLPTHNFILLLITFAFHDHHLVSTHIHPLLGGASSRRLGLRRQPYPYQIRRPFLSGGGPGILDAIAVGALLIVFVGG
ncbi:LOW QUALITY PROTEIN: hypothetical protein TorRG33x02_158120, partial [Trema orientale]